MPRIRDVIKYEKAGLIAGFVAGVVVGAIGIAALVTASGVTVLP